MMKIMRAAPLLLLLSMAAAVYVTTDCCYSDSACTTKSLAQDVIYTNVTSCAGSNSAGTCIPTAFGPSNTFTKVTACTNGAVPSPTAGVWWTYFSDSACTAGSLVLAERNNAPSCTAVPSGGPPGVVAAKAACTTGGGAQVWGYAAGDCGGSPNFVLDIGASFASSTGRAFGACGALNGPASSKSQRVACYGDQVPL